MRRSDPLHDWEVRKARTQKLQLVAVMVALAATLLLWVSLPPAESTVETLYSPPAPSPPATSTAPTTPWTAPPAAAAVADTAAPTKATKATRSPKLRPVTTQDLLALVNEARAERVDCGPRGRFGPSRPLRPHAALNRAARDQAAYLLQIEVLEHTTPGSPLGATPAERAARVGFEGGAIGENLAWGPATAEEVVQDWLDSPEHCAVLMDPGFRHVGFGWREDPAMEAGRVWAMLMGG